MKPHETPILWSAPMVLALLAGRKTQTRRTVGLEEIAGAESLTVAKGAHRHRFHRFDRHAGKWGAFLESVAFPGRDHCFVKCPYGGPGDVLWGREAIRRTSLVRGMYRETVNGVVTASSSVDRATAVYAADGATAPVDTWPWKQGTLPGIHMPRGMCRLRHQINAVRVEQLKAITEADAIAEGMEPVRSEIENRQHVTCWKWPGGDTLYGTAREAYRAGWETLHGANSFELNPLVWVLGGMKALQVSR